MSKIASTPSQKPEISLPPQRAEINPEYEDDEEGKGQKVTLIKVISPSCPGSVTERRNAWWCHVQSAQERAEHVA